MFNLSIVDFLRNRTRAIGIFCLSALVAFVSALVSADVCKGEVGPCACYGMS